MYFTVYKITNILNSMIYIGVHSTEDLNDNYMGSGTSIKADIKKYGRSNFIKEILYIFDNKDDMLQKEVEIVTEEFILREDTYNIRLGGQSYHAINMVAVLSEHDKILYIHKNNPRYKSGELKSVASGKIVVKDKMGKFYQVSVNDDRYKSGELVAGSVGVATVYDKNGKTFKADVNDYRIKLGILTPLNKNMIVAKDKMGNTYRVHKDDERLISGELVGINKGRKWINDSNGNSKFISEDLLDYFLKNGWVLGRK